jgi:hypothetical protein
MKTKTVWLSVLALSLFVNAARAQDPAAVLAPYVDEYTVIAGVIDVEKADLDALAVRFKKLGLPQQSPEEMRAGVGKAREAFLKAGGRRIYFTFNLASDFSSGPLLIIPAGKDAQKEQLQRLFRQIPELKTQWRDNDLLVGRESVLAKQKARTPKAVPEIGKAFAAVDSSTQRVVAIVPEVFRKVLREFSPGFPRDLAAGELLAAVGDGVTWAALGLDVSEKGQVRLLVQTKNDAAAQQIEKALDRTVALIQKEEKNDDAIRALKELAALLRPRVEGSQLSIALDHKTFDTAALPLVARARQQAAQQQALNNLKQIALAMHGYHDFDKALPPQFTVDKQKKALLSWRVHILPFVEHQALYQQFKLDEPWDSEHNKKLIPKMPELYRSPLSKKELEAGKTTYLVPAGPQLIFDGPKKTKFLQIPDGTSNTILAIDADDTKAVYWTQPEDLKVDPKKAKAGAVRADIGVIVAFGDGSVRILRPAISDEMMWRLFCPNDGKAIKLDE